MVAAWATIIESKSPVMLIEVENPSCTQRRHAHSPAVGPPEA